MVYEENTVENLRILDYVHGSGGGIIGLADTGGDRALPRLHCETASVAPRDYFSHRLDDSVRPDGNGRGKDLSLPRVRRPLSKSAAVRSSAGVQLFLEHSFFQSPGLRPFFSLADHAVGTDPFDDPVLLQS